MALTARVFRGEILRDARKAQRLSQTQLGSRIGAHVTSVSDWERGANSPSGRHVAALSRELGVPAEQFYDGTEADTDDSEPDMADTLLHALRSFVREEMNALRGETGAARVSLIGWLAAASLLIGAHA